MFESVFYTVMPMIVVGALALPAAVVLSLCAGAHKYAVWRACRADGDRRDDAESGK